MAKRYYTEMDAPAGYKNPPMRARPPEPSEDPEDPGPRDFKSRLRAFFSLATLRRLVPSQQSVLFLLVWVLVGLTTIQVLGAFLLPKLEAPWQVFAVAAGLAFGLPLLIAPRPTREPLAWGIGLNVLVLTALALLARPTGNALKAHGDWMTSWLEQRGTNMPTVLLVKGITAFTRLGVSLVPADQLEAQFGPIRPEEIGGPAAGTGAKAGGGADGTGPGASGAANGGSGAANGGSGAAGMGAGNGKVRAPGSDQAKAGGTLVLDPAAVVRDGMKMASADSDFWSSRARGPGSSDIDRLEKRFWEQVNLERTRQGLAAIRVRADLCQVAREHSDAMRDQGFFGHVDPQGRGPLERARLQMKDESLRGDWGVSEAVARVRDSADPPRDLVAAILRTPEERSRLLDNDTNYTGVGVGIACDGPACFGTVLFLK